MKKCRRSVSMVDGRRKYKRPDIILGFPGSDARGDEKWEIAF